VISSKLLQRSAFSPLAGVTEFAKVKAMPNGKVRRGV
jgi:hypothetical protein